MGCGASKSTPTQEPQTTSTTPKASEKPTPQPPPTAQPQEKASEPTPVTTTTTTAPTEPSPTAPPPSTDSLPSNDTQQKPTETATDTTTPADADPSPVETAQPATQETAKDIPATTPVSVTLHWENVSSLWFTDADISRGEALVALKDRVHAFAREGVFTALFEKYSVDTAGERKMNRMNFLEMIQAMEVDMDEETVWSQFHEIVGYPEDEDDEAEANAIVTSDLGYFVSAIIRVANMNVMQLGADSDGGTSGLAGQLTMLMENNTVKIDCVDNEAVKRAAQDTGREAAFYQPPASFAAEPNTKCYLDVTIDGDTDKKRIVIEVYNSKAPKTAYNFKCLCSGERGTAELCEKPLSYKGCVFHRAVPGMCIQSGDFVFNNGTGGESVYGGDFMDENFDLHHDKKGIVSMANSGPNTNSSQFFISTVANNPSLDDQHVVFGEVVEGMDVVDAIAAIPVDDSEAPETKVTIVDCGVL
eukprot:GFYU01032085.1.p1 GENE.GFYU01032085.1~~GFYU01032085.1.p1  ORF type:complete len:482 (+),score=164.37 GFYU01032085.1:27-1448(+)